MANPPADFPAAIHDPTDVSAFGGQPLGSTDPNQTDLAGKAEEELQATQTKLGINTSTPATGKVLYSPADGQSEWQGPRRVVSIQVTDPAGSAITTGDGKAYFRVPAELNGCNLVAVGAHVTTVSSSGLPTVQIANVTQAVDMLTTKITIDANEKDSSTAATPAVIDTGNDDVATGDELRIDIDVAGTGAKGLIVDLTFQLP